MSLREKLKPLSKTEMSWRHLAFVDREIVEELVNQPGKTGHTIDVGIVEDGKELSLQKKCLRSEYEMCLKAVHLRQQVIYRRMYLVPLGFLLKEIYLREFSLKV